MTHAADSHDLIRVTGARVNNLKNVSVELPKRRLTVFTGVSGSGKSSLVFDTIAAESQRMINETYSAFVQGFMPSLARPEVDVLEGLTTAIAVDQQPMGGDVRSTVGTASDANALLRILFSRLGKPHIGSPVAFSFNVPTRTASGAMTVDKGKGERIVVRKAVYQGGMCPRCEGRGTVSDIDLTALYDDSKSLNDGAITIPGYKAGGWMVRSFTESGFVDPDKPINKYTKKELNDFLYKDPTKVKMKGINTTYEGLIPKIQKSFFSKDPDSLQPHIRDFVDRAATFTACPDCGGTRLSAAARSSKINGINIADACAMQISDLAAWLEDLDEPSAEPLLANLQHTLDSFVEIGLGYLSLDRASGTLSGGEAQRTKMIRHLGSALTDVTYVFDEPSIGMHPHDIQRMNNLLMQLRDKGNTVLVVEHKPEMIEIADHVVDLGPGAGTGGGEIVFEGSVDELRASDTITGRHLDDRAALKPSVRTSSQVLEVRGAGTHNLKDVDVDIPLGILVVVTGVAGSGKSSLIHGSVSNRDGVVAVDQTPIRGSRRSNPATYTGMLDSIRKQFANANGVKAGLFSPNSDGACPSCNGAGVIYTQLGFMDTVATTCEECEGKRFDTSVLEYKLAGQRYQRGARHACHRGAGVLRRREGKDTGRPQNPYADGRCRARLSEPRSAADNPLWRRTPTLEAGHPDGRGGWDLRTRRADQWAPSRRCRPPARSSRPARRFGQVGHSDLAPSGGDGPRRLDHRPRSRCRARRRPGGVRGHPGRPGGSSFDPHRRASRRVRGLTPSCRRPVSARP